jgi:hypothetical protein
LGARGLFVEAHLALGLVAGSGALAPAFGRIPDEALVVMTARGRVARWIKMFAPGLVDKLARRAIERGI